MKEHQAGHQSHTLTNRDGGQQLKHTMLATRGEREEEKRQVEQKRQYQMCSLGIKAKSPKKSRRPQSSAKIAKRGKKPPQLQHCARLAEESVLESSQRSLPRQP